VVARLEPVKGHTYLIEALSQTVTAYPQLRCLIVGDGRTRPELETQIQKLNLQDYIHLAGFRDDIAELLCASDAFCLPSLSEGLPYALLEASAYRLPALITAVGGMAELFTHQETAFMVPPANSAALAEGIKWLITHPQEAATLGQAAYGYVQQQFNPKDMIAKTLNVYYGITR